jgi:Ca2+-binding RTX toxin-like protein
VRPAVVAPRRPNATEIATALLAAALCLDLAACDTTGPGNPNRTVGVSTPTSAPSTPTSSSASDQVTQPSPVGSPSVDRPTVTAHGTCFARYPTVVGTPGDDNIRAAKGNDVIMTLGGNDHISGLRGGDRVCAGPGDDVIEDAGKSIPPTSRIQYFSLVRVDGGPGDDTISGGNLSRVVAGDGNDRVSIGYRAQTIRLGDGNDTLRLTGLPVPLVWLGAGDDRVVIDSPLPQHIDDTTNIVFPAAGMCVDLAAGTAAGEGRDRLVGVHAIQLSGGHNIITGSPGPDWIEAGQAGDNLVKAGPGDDLVAAGGVLYGEAGNDDIRGRDGNDRLYGGPGNDHLEGGEGRDWLDGGPGTNSLIQGTSTAD